jgi:biotin-independent malonate decarboxylase gamma subunit
MRATATSTSRGRTWFHALAGQSTLVETGLGSVLVADATWGVRLLAIVPDPQNRFPRAWHGELGLEEGWTIAQQVRDAIAADSSGARRAILAIVDVQSQAYGRLEALLGIHLSLAAAVFRVALCLWRLQRVALRAVVVGMPSGGKSWSQSRCTVVTLGP